MFQLDDSKSLYRKWLFHQTSIYKWLALGFQGVNKLHPVAPLIFGKISRCFFSPPRSETRFEFNVVLFQGFPSPCAHTLLLGGILHVWWGSFDLGGGDVSGDAYPARVLYLYTPFCLKKRGSLRIKTWSPFSQKTSPKFFLLGICFVSVESYQTTSAWCTKSIFGCKKQNFNAKLVAPKPFSTWETLPGGASVIILHPTSFSFSCFFSDVDVDYCVFLDKTQVSAGCSERCFVFVCLSNVVVFHGG